jgi:hypothetical protein
MRNTISFAANGLSSFKFNTFLIQTVIFQIPFLLRTPCGHSSSPGTEAASAAYSACQGVHLHSFNCLFFHTASKIDCPPVLLFAQTANGHETLNTTVPAPSAWRRANRSAVSLLSMCLDDSNNTAIFCLSQTSINMRGQA